MLNLILLCAVTFGSIALGCCCIVDAVDKLNDRSPWVWLSGFFVVCFGAIAGWGITVLLKMLNTV